MSPISWTTPRTWLAGEVPTAGTLNTHIRDNLAAIGDIWTAYTPVWTATVNPVIGNGSITGAYMQAGKLVTFRIRILMGSTTTYGSGAYILTYPPLAPAKVQQSPGITGWIQQGSTPNGVSAIGLSTTTFRMLTNSTNTFCTNLVPFTLANGNEINIGGTYEAA